MAADDPKARQRNDLGPVGEQVRNNLKDLRHDRRMSTTALAKELADLGRPLQATAITRIEGGDRRVDVGDLVALAIALDAAPNQLLLPPLPPEALQEPAQLTPTVTVTRERAWNWAAGEWPLFDEEPTYRYDEATGKRSLVLGGLSKIQARAPHRFAAAASVSFEDVMAHLKELAEVRRAVRVLENAGLTRQQVFQALGQLDTLAQLGDSIVTLDEDSDDAR